METDTFNINSDVEEITCRIESRQVDIAPSYQDWCKLGFALAEMGESGRAYYHRISTYYPSYNRQETDAQFDRCLHSHGSGVTIKTLFYLAKQAGVDVSTFEKPERSFNSAKLPNCQTDSAIVFGNSMPTFSQSILARLPPFLLKITDIANSPEDADMLLLGSFTVFSACLPNVYGQYGQREVFPNLFLFVTAQASAGKGRLTLCRHLVNPIHQKLRSEHRAALEEYNKLMKEYAVNKKNSDCERPKEPPVKTLFVPANSSATSVYQVLNDNEGVGLMFETEGDTLANTFKSDYGNFSDGFRKAFHHETISYNRRKEREFVELEKPKFSAMLSGTPQQINALIPDAENGLFSRFIFYYLNTVLVWNDVFLEKEGESLDGYFIRLGLQYYELYRILKRSGPIRFSFTLAQKERFNSYFATVQTQYAKVFGIDIVASVRRFGLIGFRLAMILTILRIMENGEIARDMLCSDEDFSTVMEMVKILLMHTAKIFQTLPKAEVVPLTDKEKARQKLYDALPLIFNRGELLQISDGLNIALRTAERYVSKWCLSGKLEHISQGQYKKL